MDIIRICYDNFVAKINEISLKATDDIKMMKFDDVEDIREKMYNINKELKNNKIILDELNKKINKVEREIKRALKDKQTALNAYLLCQLDDNKSLLEQLKNDKVLYENSILSDEGELSELRMKANELEASHKTDYLIDYISSNGKEVLDEVRTMLSNSAYETFINLVKENNKSMLDVINYKKVEKIDPVEPVDPVDPIEPVDPIDPIDPVEPVDPIEPVDPVDSNNDKKYEELKEYVILLINKMNNNEEITKEEINKLLSLAKIDFTSSLETQKKMKEFDKEINQIISYYNLKAQENLQLKYDGEKDEKYGFASKLIEAIPGTLVNMTLNNKLIRKLRANKLSKLKADKDVSAKKVKKIINLRKKLVESDKVTGLKLFLSANKINSIKPSLYREGYSGLDTKWQKKLDNAVKSYSDVMEFGLERKLKDKTAFKDEERNIGIAKQYLKLLSISEDYEDLYNKLICPYISSLKSNSDLNMAMEAKSLEALADKIYNFRNNSDKFIYQYDEEELDKIESYYQDADKEISKRFVYSM